MSKHIGLSLLSILLVSGGVLLPSSSPLAYCRPVANVKLGNTSQNKVAVYASNDSVQFTVQVVTSADVPNTATAKVDFLDFGNSSSVAYAVDARTQTKVLGGGGQSTGFTFRMTTNGENTNTGTVTLQFSLDSATGAAVIAPLTANVSVVVQSPGTIGGGCNPQDRAFCQADGGYWINRNCECLYDTPIIIDVEGNEFDLTNAADGVVFDFDGTGNPRRLAWTMPNSDDAFLVLDRNNNGRIDNGTELFGNLTPQTASSSPNGFIALAEYDKPAKGGNGDGKIDENDAVFALLRLWQDANHDGVSDASELHPLASKGVVSIDLDYKESRRQDRYGNLFRYRAKVEFSPPGPFSRRWAADVFLMRE
ncbi:MAG: hypothetical protein AABO41_10020 [Acidobacteriota bacterium]